MSLNRRGRRGVSSDIVETKVAIFSPLWFAACLNIPEYVWRNLAPHVPGRNAVMIPGEVVWPYFRNQI
jgi:hypothetical protein